MNYWLVKTEPETYSWQRFVEEGRAVWDGVRNYQARNNLKKMKSGDMVLFYHSDVGKEVVGVARVSKESYPDPTAKDPGWVAVDLEPVSPLKNPIRLQAIKKDHRLKGMILVRNSRLSVMPVSSREFDLILRISELEE